MNLPAILKKYINRQTLPLILLGFLLLIFLLLQVSQIFSPRRFSQKAKADEAIPLTFDPASADAALNADFTVKLKLAPQSPLVIQGYLITLSFDKSKMKIKEDGIQYLKGAASVNLGADDNSKISTINGDSGQATLKMYGEIQSATGLTVSSATDLAQITFTSKTADATTITVSTPKVVKIGSDGVLTEVPMSVPTFNLNGVSTTATLTPTPPPGATNTPTPPPSGNVTLNLKLKFQGITTKPSTTSMNVRVKLGGAQTTDYQQASFTSNDNGIWSGTVAFNTTPGSGFIVYVKGPKHIQKKICAATPTETSPGTYHCGQGTIALVTGANTLDFSGVLQLGGDLPDQDGTVNSYDISLVRNNLNKTDAETVRLADLNLDGKVDTQDYSLVIAALSVRSDEE